MYIAGKYKNSDVGSKKRVGKKENDWIKIPNHHPAIVDKSAFDAVRKITSDKAPKSTKRKMGTAERYRNIDKTLNGKVVCGCCGHVMRLSSTTNAKYHCSHTRVAIEAECYRLNVLAKELRDMLFEVISKQAQVILNVDYLSKISEIDFQIEKQNDKQKQIEHLNQEKCKLYERLIVGELTTDEYKIQKIAIDTKIARLSQTNNAFAAETMELNEMKTCVKQNREIAEFVASETSLTRPIVDLLIEKVLIYPDNRVDIQWKVSDFFNNHSHICAE